MKTKTPICPERIRRITGSFSWLDHRLLSQRFLSSMSKHEILLYFFLVLVGDRNGVSFYSDEKICSLLKISTNEFIQARELLIKRSLIAYGDGSFQVLQLPTVSSRRVAIERNHEATSMKDIFKKILVS